MDYLVVKWLHVMSSTLLFGTGLGIAFFMWMAHLRCDPRVIAVTARHVVIADSVFTAPAVIVQFVTGLWLADALSVPLTSGWLLWALLLFFFVGACWLPVVWLQMRARRLAENAVATNQALPPAYFSIMRWWYALGWPAFLGVVAIFWLMVRKGV